MSVKAVQDAGGVPGARMPRLPAPLGAVPGVRLPAPLGVPGVPAARLKAREEDFVA